ncbi:response regulator [Nitrospira sp. Nam74]
MHLSRVTMNRRVLLDEGAEEVPVAMSSREKVRLLLVDDREVVQRLRELLQQAQFNVVGESDTMASAVEHTIRLKPDTVVMDLRLPDGAGIDVCRKIPALSPQTCVLVLTSFSDEEVMPAPLVGSAHGHLHKTIRRQALIDGVSAPARRSLDRSVTAHAVAPRHPSESSVGKKKSTPLAPQESRVLALLADGKTNKEIGVALGLSDKTIKNYVSHIFQKLQIRRRSQAAAFYIRHCAT